MAILDLDAFRRLKERVAQGFRPEKVEFAPELEERLDDLSERLARAAGAWSASWELGEANVRKCAPGRELLAADSGFQRAFLLRTLQFMNEPTWQHRPDTVQHAFTTAVAALLRRDLLTTEQDLVRVVRLTTSAFGKSWGSVWGYFWQHRESILSALVVVLDAWRDREGDVPDATKADLRRLLSSLSRLELPADMRRVRARLHDMALGEPPTPLRAGDAWADRARADLSAMSPGQRQAWYALLVHVRLATSTRPKKSWSKTAAPLVEAVGADDIQSRLIEWFAELRAPKPSEEADVLDEDNTDALKGLVFVAGMVPSDALAGALADLTERCFRKIPGVGPVARRVGNAAILVLSQMPGLEPSGQLGRLAGRLKYAQARRLVEGALERVADREGLSSAQLAELGVPTYGLDPSGVLRREVGDHVAELRIVDGRAVELTWVRSTGKRVKSVPKSVKEEHADAVKELRKLRKDVETMLLAQRQRMEALLIEDPSWPFLDWRGLYGQHAILAAHARRLIWCVEQAGSSTSCAWWKGQFVDLEGHAVEPGEGAEVTLWHPLGRDVQEVLAWRRWIEGRGLTQPFKQAHREIYVLTDAERETECYSNRFAGHFLAQHQLAALCRDRGWRYQLQGTHFDGGNYPEVDLGNDLHASYAVEPLEGEHESVAGISLYVRTDRVQFHEGSAWQDPVALTELPARVFSEVMRTVDLFVGVASIGNDPSWADGGPAQHAGPVADYWASWAMGSLLESARTRRAVLETLVPRLGIGPRCSFTDRHLVVRGEWDTYRIHIGSANVLRESNGSYVCIVPGAPRRGAAGPSRIALPFEGDPQLGVILSKALLLADETKIRDRSILAQLARP